MFTTSGMLPQGTDSSCYSRHAGSEVTSPAGVIDGVALRVFVEHPNVQAVHHVGRTIIRARTWTWTCKESGSAWKGLTASTLCTRCGRPGSAYNTGNEVSLQKRMTSRYCVARVCPAAAQKLLRLCLSDLLLEHLLSFSMAARKEPRPRN